METSFMKNSIIITNLEEQILHYLLKFLIKNIAHIIWEYTKIHTIIKQFDTLNSIYPSYILYKESGLFICNDAKLFMFDTNTLDVINNISIRCISPSAGMGYYDNYFYCLSFIRNYMFKINRKNNEQSIAPV